ncbi:uncharacterized protein [Pagrus major]|uniref:uncharacterized protein n=1 Tax=Pagrus major TaxID=143350 RepID=UPI003CC8830D
MDLLWMILPLLLVRVNAENTTELKVELGQNVTLNCSWNDIPKIYWYLEIHSQVRARIVQIHSNTADGNEYFVYPSNTKYEAIKGNRLVIRNITAEDCRLYFCAKRNNDNIIFVDTFRIISAPSNNSFIPDVSSHSEANDQQHSSRIWQNDVITYSSLALNALLSLVVIGLVFKSLCLKSKNCNNQVNQSHRFDCENLETVETPQYEEIQLDRAPPPVAPPSECIYYKAQLPRPTLPQH